MTRLLITGFLSLLSLFAQADIFQWRNADGIPSFSDRPHLGARVLEISPGYSFYQIKKVYDGDTILLNNGKKVRFLGINTPEVEKRNQPGQVGGEAAKQWLIKRLKGHTVRLEKDVEYKDKYGRLLAHIFTDDQQHINLELVQRGLATVNIYPPNLKYSQLLLQAQSQAEQAKLGLWKDKAYARKPVSAVKKTRLKGWQRLVGRVNSIGYGKKYSYLNLTDYFSVKIANDSLDLFPDLSTYRGQLIEVRGWVNRHKNHFSLFVRHPSALIIQ